MTLLFPDFTCCPNSPPSKYAAKRKKRRAYTRTSAACCAVHATLACAWHTLSLFAFGDESYRPPRPLLASSLPPFCAFVKCGMRLLFSLEPLFSFRKRKARAQPITQHNTHTYKGKCMQAQTEVHVASGMYKCRGRGIFRGGGCGGWWPRKSREAQGARNTLQRQLETPKRRRRKNVHYQDGRKRREGKRGGRWAAEVAGRRSMGVPDRCTHRKSTAKAVCCSESREKITWQTCQRT